MTDLEQYLEIYGDELRPLSQRIGELLAGQNPGVVTGVLADCCAGFILGPSIHDAFRAAALDVILTLLGEMIEAQHGGPLPVDDKNARRAILELALRPRKSR
jgi:hypothetical protein